MGLEGDGTSGDGAIGDGSVWLLLVTVGDGTSRDGSVWYILCISSPLRYQIAGYRNSLFFYIISKLVLRPFLNHICIFAQNNYDYQGSFSLSFVLSFIVH